MSSNLLRVVQEQQETIEKQSRLIADLIATLESWEQTAGYDGAELKERAKDLQLRERQAIPYMMITAKQYIPQRDSRQAQMFRLAYRWIF